MCTITLSYNANDARACEHLAVLLNTGLFVQLEEEQQKNRVYVDNGKVMMNTVTDTMSIEEAKELTLKAIDLEYSLP